MKGAKFIVYGMISILISISLTLPQCTSNQDSTYQELMVFADGIKVINTHEHQHWPEEFGDLEFGLFHLLQGSYLISDVISAGGTGMEWESVDSLTAEGYWKINGEAIDFCRSTSYYSHFIEGFQKLYDFDDLYFTENNIQDLSGQVEENYTDYRRWFDEAFHRAGFELMFQDQWWRPINTYADEKYFAHVFNIYYLVMQSSDRPSQGAEDPEVYMLAKEAGLEINSLDDYLAYSDHLFHQHLEHQVVAVKNALAYGRSLDFDNIPYEVASDLFAKPSEELSPEEAKMIQDFMFHWIIQKSIEYDLPIQIHTGYLAGNANTLDNGKPVKLNNLFLEYPEAKFVLFHGGYPWTGEYAAFGKMFPNVYLDIVWLPQISRQEAVHGLEEMFDAVPYNKFFWGGDCKFIEESTGSLEFGKSVVTEVLANRIERGLLTNEVARKMIQSIFRENAIEVFQLEERLGREF